MSNYQCLYLSFELYILLPFKYLWNFDTRLGIARGL